MAKRPAAAATLLDRAAGRPLWQKTDTPRSSHLLTALANHDGTFVLGGSIEHEDGQFDQFLVKLDEQGNVLWDRTLGSEEHRDSVHDLIRTRDGESVVAGIGAFEDSGNRDLLLTRFDEQGAPDVDFIIGPDTSGDDFGVSIDELASGDLVLAIGRPPNPTPDDHDVRADPTCGWSCAGPWASLARRIHPS